MKPMQDGDVFQWSWKEIGPRTGTSPYWCCSCLAVFRKGLLTDTYWGGGENKCWNEEDAQRLLVLTRIGNLTGFKPSANAAWTIDNYFPIDVIDLRHSNGGEVWLREGAEPSLKIQLGTARRKLAEAKRKAEDALSQVAWRGEELGFLQAKYEAERKRQDESA